jgi:hypothetical protein
MGDLHEYEGLPDRKRKSGASGAPFGATALRQGATGTRK